MARYGYLTMSMVFYIAGLLCILLRGRSVLAFCVGSGIVLMLYGTIKIVGYFSKDLYCLAFQYDLACGLLLAVLGALVLLCRERVAPYLLPVLGVLVLLDSLLSVQMSRDARQFGLETWPVILATSAAAAVFSVLLIAQPFSGPLAARIVTGGTLLAEGLKSHCVVSFTVKAPSDLPASE